MSYALGVDLGTTFVAAAIANPTQVEMFTLGDRSVVTPAVVYLREDSTTVTGEAADRRALINPDRVGREFKRRLGDPTPVVLGGTPHAVTDLLGTLLRDVLARVIAAEGGPPDQVVLTCPANWGPFRRGLFDQVPIRAGLTSTLIITEPEAAAVHYATSRELAEGEMIAVYDLGGGTFDATVLRNRGNGVEILGAPEGIERLGGVDFDEAILNFVNYTSGGALSELDVRDPRSVVALARLRQDCVQAKEALSTDDEIVLPVFLPSRHFNVSITRADFEGLVRAPIESTVGALSRTLRSAGVTPAELSAVLLVGGSSRIPLVTEMVSRELGRPIVVDTHPKYAVALGAAALARLAVRSAHTKHTAANGGRRNSRAAPRPAVPVASAHLPQSPQPPPQTQTSPTVSSPPRVAGTGGRNWPVIILGIAAVTVLTVALGFAAYLLGLYVGSFGSSDATASRPPTAVRVMSSVPVPSLGAAIWAGPTPGFAAVSPSGRQVYIANQNAKVITVVDTSINKVTATVPVDAGPPQYLAFAPNGKRVYVSVFTPDQAVTAIAVLDTTTNRIIASIPVPSRPYVSAVTKDSRYLWVPNHDIGELSVIDTLSLAVVKEIKVPRNPHWVGFSVDGSRAYTANHDSNVVAVLDVATGTVIAEVPVGISPHALAVNPRRPLVAGVNYNSDSVSFIDTDANKVSATVPVGRHPDEIGWAPDGRYVYVTNESDGTVSVVEADTAKVTATIPTGDTPTSVAVRPDGSQAYVSNLDSGTLSVLDVGG